MPWDEFIKIGIGKMGLSPSEFWNMAINEFYLAIDGFAEFHNGSKDSPLTRDELEDLMERYPD